ncbi:hypothetical protein PROFUN_00983 [Planoprotostelium fungivorum]|uniref:Large ribosomal subunit protein eL14 domain-containing protein n=1 Tax=Planoprotostelium fungivorum TaxID=1890364 RepID=A0A2P6N4C7_9EUKA|nr:hypothetical protein PROFUN_00983 [Planoprotostelium fungivorum]
MVAFNVYHFFAERIGPCYPLCFLLDLVQSNMPLYTRFIQVGRVVNIINGDDADKLAVVVEIIDQNRLLIEGAGVARQVIKTDYVAPTDIVVPNLPRAANSKFVKAAFEKSGAAEKFAQTPFGKKLAKSTLRGNLSDFQRHQAYELKRKRNAAVAKEFRPEAKAHKKSNPIKVVRK